MQVTDIKHLVLSGGGLLGISYIGLAKFLEESLSNPIIKNFKSITGCSAGAIFGSLIAIGYTSTELQNIIKEMNFKEYININAESLINFMKLKGLESGKTIINFIKKCIKDKTNNENITFKEIKDKFNIDLQIGVTNLTKSRFELMNSKNTPNIPIHKAISASIAIPLIFEPVIIDDDIFCDGGLLNNLPIETLFGENNEEDNEEEDEDNEEKKEKDKEDNTINYSSILGIYLLTQHSIVNKDNYKSIPLSQYMNIMIHALSAEHINNKIQYNNSNKKYKIIIFNIPCDIMSFLKINSSHEDIDNIIDIAYKTTSAAFVKAAPKL